MFEYAFWFQCVLTLENHYLEDSEMKQYPYASFFKSTQLEKEKTPLESILIPWDFISYTCPYTKRHSICSMSPALTQAQVRVDLLNLEPAAIDSKAQITPLGAIYCSVQAEVFAFLLWHFLLIFSCHLVLNQSLKVWPLARFIDILILNWALYSTTLF